MSEPLLHVRDLSKRFGGLVANDNIDLAVNLAEIHALIGPNGAGKTTLIAQIAGELRPTAGTIWFDGRDITAFKPHQRAAVGLSRSFQVTSIFPSFSAFENVALAAQVQCGHSFRFWAPAHDAQEINELAGKALRQVGLDDKGTARAGDMSHGDHRLLEIAMALAGQPKLILMDEPTAGMGSTETQHLVALLARLRESCAILLVEHDMDVVFSLADRITVLDNGRSIASGTPHAIRSDERVRGAYLGREHEKLSPRYA
jgi:branched-chain amino acid transport system ATP-binding protein